mmetsp:Transcript_67950/g.196817  ORF Transcript_67950/g.196817 Transcript_67950/m.196817 type:complete len:234 (+) Transcript_67950:828-1529(+)
MSYHPPWGGERRLQRPAIQFQDDGRRPRTRQGTSGEAITLGRSLPATASPTPPQGNRAHPPAPPRSWPLGQRTGAARHLSLEVTLSAAGAEAARRSSWPPGATFRGRLAHLHQRGPAVPSLAAWIRRVHELEYRPPGGQMRRRCMPTSCRGSYGRTTCSSGMRRSDSGRGSSIGFATRRCPSGAGLRGARGRGRGQGRSAAATGSSFLPSSCPKGEAWARCHALSPCKARPAR